MSAVRAFPPPAPMEQGGSQGAWATALRGLRLSPELREGLALTMLLALLATAGRAIVPVAVQRTIDRGLRGGAGPVDVRTTLQLVLVAVLAVGLAAAANGGMIARLARAVETALSNLRVKAFRHIHDLSALHQASRQRGGLVARVTTDIDEISRFLQSGGLNLATGLGQITVATAVMLAYSWQLTIVVLTTFVPFALLARAVQIRLNSAYMTVRERVGALLGAIGETVVGAATIRAYGLEVRIRTRLGGHIEAHRVAAVRAGRLSAIFSASAEVFAALATAAAVITGVYSGVAGRISPGVVVAFLFLIALFVEPVRLVTETLNEAQTAVAGWRRVLDVLDVAPDVVDPPDGIDLPPGPVRIALEHVSFRYPRPGETAAEATGTLALSGLNLVIPAGTDIAVVGETGSGKTTFAKLLTRLMDPSSGRVLINGVLLQTVRFASLRDRVVLVPQEGMLFDGTVADNVRHGRPDADDEELQRAFVELGVADWLDALPHRLEQPVGERGRALSAGERQLVALARAYVARPDLLVLDEATSSIDPRMESRLRRALAGLS
ncbi:MAG: ABC transporter ATP-binding protein/permease, partial [Actinomycetota bacterium]|nr:ABC transporter ATP-binding protein/permease [Actinomycetota bacterium]